MHLFFLEGSYIQVYSLLTIFFLQYFDSVLYELELALLGLRFILTLAFDLRLSLSSVPFI
jgi:hypothetical protein